MNKTAIECLEFEKIKERISSFALSAQGREMIERLQPSGDIAVIRGWLRETTEARAIVNRFSGVPLQSLSGMDKIMEKFGKGTLLYPEELWRIARFLEGGKKLRKFMLDKDSLAPLVSTYALSICELEDLKLEIDRCIQNNRVDDRASSELARIRKKLAVAEARIEEKLASILKSPAYRDYLQDGVVSMRNGSYVIPVKREHRRSIEGTVLDTSSSGSTVFIEPAGVRRLREELGLLKQEEEKEEYKILSYLAGLAEGYAKELGINLETMAHYDFIFAKAKYSKAVEGQSVGLNTGGYVRIKSGRHPLIEGAAVPLEFEIGREFRALVITGPNTGGKTVVLKTVGLLSMMAQAGLHVPVEEGSELCVFKDILVDIGDGQSIEQSLSTFSSHIRNIASIMECADKDTLVIMDELGTGTDPGEGMGLAVAVMEEIFAKGAAMIVTTHYSEIKDFAARTPGFRNGSMEFDINTLRPLYRLNIGLAGESNAFLIALRLGMKRSVIERAHEVTYREKKEYSGHLSSTDSEELKNREVIVHKVELKEKDRKLQEARQTVGKQKIEHRFSVGDCVFVSSMNRTGIVCEEENHKGEVGVMIMKHRFKINGKRLSLYIEGQELYPENYDFDIVFESKENRKKRHKLGKKHVEGLVIEAGRNE